VNSLLAAPDDRNRRPANRPRVAYLAHDLSDSAVSRRVEMFGAGEADVKVAGFCRASEPPPTIEDAPITMLGRTYDSALAQRAIRLTATLARPGVLETTIRSANVIVARNLEMLLLAQRVRFFAPNARLVYECLDIHRSLLGGTIASRALRWIERRALRGVDLVLISSPEFQSKYLEPFQTITAPVMLVENKLLMLAPSSVPLRSRPAGPRWTIGWFGNLRCRKTMAALRRLALEGAGRVEILIAGRPSEAEFNDFASLIVEPYMRFVGPYSRDELPDLYAQCHFAWAIDYFEEGLNSSWLLPNRLYEAIACGAVPVALAHVATGAWLARRNAGVLLSNRDSVDELLGMLIHLDPRGYAVLHDRISAVPRSAIIATRADCIDLVEALAG
jgi:succinoglycan biosynthesis protein ExoL